MVTASKGFSHHMLSQNDITFPVTSSYNSVLVRAKMLEIIPLDSEFNCMYDTITISKKCSGHFSEVMLDMVT